MGAKQPGTPDAGPRPAALPAKAQPAAEPKPAPATAGRPTSRPKEIDGPEGPEPTRYGDWEVNGRCSDF
jgi:hypothetical protein